MATLSLHRLRHTREVDVNRLLVLMGTIGGHFQGCLASIAFWLAARKSMGHALLGNVGMQHDATLKHVKTSPHLDGVVLIHTAKTHGLWIARHAHARPNLPQSKHGTDSMP
jgi:hypothetical protein